MRDRFKCSECGCPNEVGRIFCVRCGVKLDFTRMRRPIRIDVGGILSGVFRLIMFLAVLSVVALIVWPLGPAGQVGNADDAREWLRQRDAIKNGDVDKIEAAEASLNAYLLSTLKQPATNSTATASRWQMKLDAVNVTMRSDHVTVMAVTQWGPLTITWSISGVPQVQAEHSVLDIKDGRLGHLPLPPVVTAWVANRMVALLARWPHDRELLEQLKGLTLAAGRATLAIRPAQPKA